MKFSPIFLSTAKNTFVTKKKKANIPELTLHLFLVIYLDRVPRLSSCIKIEMGILSVKFKCNKG